MRWRGIEIRLTGTQIMVVAFICLALILLVSLAQRAVLNERLQATRQSLENETIAIEARVERLRGMMEEVQTPAAIEQALRDDFGVVRPGEGAALLQFAESPAEEDPAPAADVSEKRAPPHWLDWLRRFRWP